LVPAFVHLLPEIDETESDPSPASFPLPLYLVENGASFFSHRFYFSLQAEPAVPLSCSPPVSEPPQRTGKGRQLRFFRILSQGGSPFFFFRSPLDRTVIPLPLFPRAAVFGRTFFRPDGFKISPSGPFSRLNAVK